MLRSLCWRGFWHNSLSLYLYLITVNSFVEWQGCDEMLCGWCTIEGGGGEGGEGLTRGSQFKGCTSVWYCTPQALHDRVVLLYWVVDCLSTTSLLSMKLF